MSPETSLAAWLRRIGTEHPRGVLRGLAGVREVASALAVLPPAPCSIVVAGTNGKGSTTVFAEQLLLAAGHSVGSTLSPHVHVFNERIRINGQTATDDAIVAAFETVEAARSDVELSYFEYAILAALAAIAAAECEFAVLEVGLGGRLDAVNAVDADVAVVTSVGLDHQQYLGDDREQIGAEKAAIARAGRPLVAGEADLPRSVLAHAAALPAPVRLAGREFGWDDGRLWCCQGEERLEFEYRATHAIDPANAATALQAVCLAGCRPRQADVDRAARGACNPGRFEVVEHGERTWVLDVAHNPAAARFFAEQLKRRFPNRRMAAVVGCLEDKDIAGIVAALKPLVAEFAYATTATTRGRSSASSRAAAGDDAAFAGTLDEAVAHLSRRPAEDVILVLGSFDVVERTRARFHLHRSRDAMC